MELLYYENDNLLELTGLKNASTDAYINDATVTVTVKTEAGVEVTGQTWPATLSYVASANGVYRVTLENDLAVTPGTIYEAIVTATSGALKGKWTVRCRCVTRNA